MAGRHRSTLVGIGPHLAPRGRLTHWSALRSGAGSPVIGARLAVGSWTETIHEVDGLRDGGCGCGRPRVEPRHDEIRVAQDQRAEVWVDPLQVAMAGEAHYSEQFTVRVP